MLISEVLNKYILKLDDERKLLDKKFSKSIVWHIITPIIAAVGALFITKFPPAFIYAAMITGFISALVYSINIGSPFKELKSQLKAAVLSDLMNTFHPDIDYTYENRKQDVREISRETGFFSANRYHEEDVFRGTYDDAEFYISEVKLSRKRKKSTRTLFDGLLFSIRIPGKQFPETRIQSSVGMLSQFFSGYKLNEELGFHYESEDPRLFEESMGNLFPFFQHLTRTNKNLRIKLQGNEIVMFLSSDMKFFDDPKPTISESFLNNKYVENFAQQLNSVLFIVESLKNNLNSQEIEERLELKVLEYAKDIEGSRKRQT